MNENEFIKQYKENELIHSVNFEGDLILSERQLEQMLKEYADTKQLNIADVSKDRELLSAFLKWHDITLGANADEELNAKFIDEYLKV